MYGIKYATREKVISYPTTLTLLNLPHTNDIDAKLLSDTKQLRNLLWMTTKLHAELALALGVSGWKNANNHPENEPNKTNLV